MRLKYGLIIDGGISHQDIGRVVKIQREQNDFYVLRNGFCTAVAKRAIILISKEQYEFLEYINREREAKLKYCDHLEANGGDYIQMLRDIGELKTTNHISEDSRIFAIGGLHDVSVSKTKMPKVRKTNNYSDSKTRSSNIPRP